MILERVNSYARVGLKVRGVQLFFFVTLSLNYSFVANPKIRDTLHGTGVSPFNAGGENCAISPAMRAEVLCSHDIKNAPMHGCGGLDPR